MNKPYVVVVDVETTSVDQETAGVCQIAAVLLSPSEEDFTFAITPLFETYCRPTSERMSPEAEKIHGITPDKYFLAPEDTVSMGTLERVISGVGDNVVIAGYNSERFDLPIINRRNCSGSPCNTAV